jgi:hypothetical protein
MAERGSFSLCQPIERLDSSMGINFLDLAEADSRSRISLRFAKQRQRDAKCRTAIGIFGPKRHGPQ